MSAGEAGARVVGPDEDVALVDEVRVEERGEGGGVDDGDHARVDADEEGEGGRDVGAEHGAAVRRRALPEGEEEEGGGKKREVFFYIKFILVSRYLKGHGPAMHDLTNSGSWISSLRVRGPKWHRATSLRAASVFNS